MSNTTHLPKGSRQDLGSVPLQTNTNQQTDESLGRRRKLEARGLPPPPPTLEPSSKQDGRSTVSRQPCRCTSGPLCPHTHRPRSPLYTCRRTVQSRALRTGAATGTLLSSCSGADALQEEARNSRTRGNLFTNRKRATYIRRKEARQARNTFICWLLRCKVPIFEASSRC